MDKIQLRKYMSIVRQTFDIKDYNADIIKNIQLFPSYQTAQNVMIYYPMKNEIDLRPLLKDNKNFYLPKIIGNEIYACPYKPGDKLILSEYKTHEPVTEPVSRNILDLVIVPGICADYSKNRIGYGKGFYDRFLGSVNGIKIYVCPQLCVIRDIPEESHDKKVDFIITEKGVIC